MSLQQLFRAIFKRKKMFWLVFSFLFIISIPFIALNQKERFKSYIFFTVAPKEYQFKEDNQPSINSFYLISASDIFAETIIGWFKNPVFIDDIEKKSGISPLPTFSTRKETKQNVMIFFTTEKEEDNNKLSTAIIQQIQKAVAEYNQATNTTFSLVNLATKMFTITPGILSDTGISIATSFILALVIVGGVAMMKKGK